MCPCVNDCTLPARVEPDNDSMMETVEGDSDCVEVKMELDFDAWGSWSDKDYDVSYGQVSSGCNRVACKDLELLLMVSEIQK